MDPQTPDPNAPAPDGGDNGGAPAPVVPPAPEEPVVPPAPEQPPVEGGDPAPPVAPA